MWMLGALIVPIGIGIAVRDVLKANTLELGDECSDSKHCKSGTCLTGEPSVCTQDCNALKACPAGFTCQKVKVTLQNQAGFHDLGTQSYCFKASGAETASSSSAASSASAPASAAASASAPPPPPPPADSASSAPSATSSAKPATKTKAKPKPKGK